MQQRTVVRSLTTNDGTLVAMNDGTVAWKPIEGRPTRTLLEGLPTVLLALRGPMGPIDSAVIGTADGEVVVYTLPRLEVVAKFSLKSGSIRAITLVEQGAFHFLVGTQHGAVWSVCDHRTERAELIFSIDGPVSSLRIEGELVHVRSGWIHHVRAWDGSSHDIRNTAESYTIRKQRRLRDTYFLPYPA
ncbi:MAG: hypothetical protein CMB00_04985 [Euryarchaeota archaeon]|jgi:hypothetical protein|nr:hypothetical protein [Euryarchaeota archaeon]|tara:strand:+ start:505 stop:1068 length:564 start_codon:yes stop_codon:yes gene_type:complete